MKTASRFALVFYYSGKHRYSINALLGAIEQDEELKNLNTFLFENPPDLLKGIRGLPSHYEKAIVGISFFTTELLETIKSC